MSFTVVATIISILLTFLGIYLTIRLQKKPKLSFANEGSFALFNDVSENIEGINVIYQGNPLKSNILLLKGTIVNNGRTDIDSSIVHEPLKINLPEDFSWEQFKITRYSKKLKINSKRNGNSITINWSLFKKNEFFSFTSLLLVPENFKSNKEIKQNINKFLNFDFRITNLDKVNKGVSSTVLSKKNWYSERVFPLIMLFLFFLMGTYLFLYREKPTEISKESISYEINLDGQKTEILFYQGFNNKLIIKNKEKQTIMEGNAEEILNKYNFKPIINTQNNAFHSKVVGLILMIVCGFFIIIIFSTMLNDRRLFNAYFNSD